ncbi:MAG: tRNA pseudouridine(13) synthase TruD, partial [Deltaproteobacteria bacterium]|nr:tRNA pseudouridine(13) synthase TruD [Deltaproteobacteria bacterium]
DRFLRRIAISAYQSWLFNRVLAERIADGLFATALDGDLMKKLDTGGLFTCDAPATDEARLARFEISATGPMFGPRMLEPARASLDRERRVHDAEGLSLASFEPLKGDGEGTRRPTRLPLSLTIDDEGEAVVLGFALPKGSFATAVLREVQKAEAPADLPEEREG